MWVARCRRCARVSGRSQPHLKAYLHLTSTPTPPHLCSCPGERRSGATDRWSGERRRLTHAHQSQPDSPAEGDFPCVLLCRSWLIERKVAGTTQVSTVGYLPSDPPPLSYLDSSSALSPWTSYQYRLVLHNQAGNSTGENTDPTQICVRKVPR